MTKRIALACLFLLLLILLLLGPSMPAQAPPARDEKAPAEELETFEPSEKVPADNAVSFPVDI